MSHTSEIDNNHPDGLREIRSWAARSPDSARPGFRTRHLPTGPRPSRRFVGSALIALLLVLLSLAGYRFFQNGRGASDLAALPEPQPEQVAQVVPESEEAPPAAEAPEAVADLPQVRKEPVQAGATRPEPPIPEERPRNEAAVVPRRPTPKEHKIVTRIAVSREAFESEPAVLLSTPAAAYPDAARGTGTSAEVIVGFTIDEAGAVRNPAVESSRVQGDAPEALFKEAALAAARRARFHPARERGVPTSSWNTLTFSFETGPPPAKTPATHPPDTSRTGSTR